MMKHFEIPHGVIIQPSNSGHEITLTIARPDKNLVNFDFTSPKMSPQWRPKNRAENDRFEEIRIQLPINAVAERMGMSQESGQIDVYGRSSIIVMSPHVIKPSFYEVSGYYNRSKGRKLLFRCKVLDSYPVMGIHWVMKKWKRTFAIDTNTATVQGHRVSVTCALIVNVLPETGKQGTYKVDSYYSDVNIDVEGNPETHAICKLIERVQMEYMNSADDHFGIITDSELSSIDGYNNQSVPLIDNFFLPSNFHIFYATDSSGRETFMPNSLIAQCDRLATEELRTARIVKR